MVKRFTGVILAMGLVMVVPAAAQDTMGVDPAEVAAALAELDDGGTPATASEIAEFLTAATLAPSRGAVSGRFRQSGGGGWDQTVRGFWSGSWWDTWCPSSLAW